MGQARRDELSWVHQNLQECTWFLAGLCDCVAGEVSLLLGTLCAGLGAKGICVYVTNAHEESCICQVQALQSAMHLCSHTTGVSHLRGTCVSGPYGLF